MDYRLSELVLNRNQPKAEIITQQKARSLVTEMGWKFIQQGKTSYSRDMRWIVSGGQGVYKRRPCKPVW